MALKTKEDKPVQSDTTVLELALYTQYTWLGTTFVKGKPYRFKNADAMQLLSEQDYGRPVWSLYRPPTKAAAAMNSVVDATNITVPEPDEEPLPGTLDTGRKRIEVGTDDEIADILGKVEDEGNVTV